MSIKKSYFDENKDKRFLECISILGKNNVEIAAKMGYSKVTGPRTIKFSLLDAHPLYRLSYWGRELFPQVVNFAVLSMCF